MPKILETKKTPSKTHSKIVNKFPGITQTSPPAQKEEKKAVVFRLFECVVQAEQAAASLGKIGIFPGNKPQLKETHAKLLLEVKALAKAYNDAWGEMQIKK